MLSVSWGKDRKSLQKAAKQFIETIAKYKSIAIYIPGSPDPDAIASAYVIKLIIERLGNKADIFAEKKLSLPQNKAFTNKLKIPLSYDKKVKPSRYDAYIVPDFQNNMVESIGYSIPCAVHIDHHSAAQSPIKADFTYIREDAGSTSTLVALLVKNLDISFNQDEMNKIATALTFGIQTDTDKYNNLTALDVEALRFLTKYTDSILLEAISSIPPSQETLDYYKIAMANEVSHKDWGFFGIGYIDAKTRDSIALSADMIIKSKPYKTIAVYAIVEDINKAELYLDVSLRTMNKSVDLNRVIKRITPNGGARKYKGAYQVRLNYFLNSPDREILWKLIDTTTKEALRKSRDSLYITGLESFYNNVKVKLFSLLKKENGSN